MEEEIIFNINLLKQQINDFYKDGFLNTSRHNQAMFTIDIIEKLVKEHECISEIEERRL